MSSCVITGCSNLLLAKGFCAVHYKSQWKYGDPLYATSLERKAATQVKLLARRPPWLGKKRPPHSAETRAKMRASHLARNYHGREHHLFGKSPAHVKRILYRGIKFRSSYEVAFAKALDERRIKWRYEPRRFDLGSCTYTPDFWIPAFGAFWELKGFFHRGCQEKTRLFRQRFPELPLVLATKPVLKQFGLPIRIH